MMRVLEKTTVVFDRAECIAFQAWLDEPVDWDVAGTPISRRATLTEEDMAIMEYGWHARAGSSLASKGESNG